VSREVSPGRPRREETVPAPKRRRAGRAGRPPHPRESSCRPQRRRNDRVSWRIEGGRGPPAHAGGGQRRNTKGGGGGSGGEQGGGSERDGVAGGKQAVEGRAVPRGCAGSGDSSTATAVPARGPDRLQCAAVVAKRLREAPSVDGREDGGVCAARATERHHSYSKLTPPQSCQRHPYARAGVFGVVVAAAWPTSALAQPGPKQMGLTAADSAASRTASDTRQTGVGACQHALARTFWRLARVQRMQRIRGCCRWVAVDGPVVKETRGRRRCSLPIIRRHDVAGLVDSWPHGWFFLGFLGPDVLAA